MGEKAFMRVIKIIMLLSAVVLTETGHANYSCNYVFAQPDLKQNRQQNENLRAGRYVYDSKGHLLIIKAIFPDGTFSLNPYDNSLKNINLEYKDIATKSSDPEDLVEEGQYVYMTKLTLGFYRTTDLLEVKGFFPSRKILLTATSGSDFSKTPVVVDQSSVFTFNRNDFEKAGLSGGQYLTTKKITAKLIAVNLTQRTVLLQDVYEQYHVASLDEVGR